METQFMPVKLQAKPMVEKVPLEEVIEKLRQKQALPLDAVVASKKSAKAKVSRKNKSRKTGKARR